jgi:hypothetical protein
MGRHRKGTKLIGFHDEESIDMKLTALAKQVGVTKTELLRLAVREKIAKIQNISDLKTWYGLERPTDVTKPYRS